MFTTVFVIKKKQGRRRFKYTIALNPHQFGKRNEDVTKLRFCVPKKRDHFVNMQSPSREATVTPQRR